MLGLTSPGVSFQGIFVAILTLTSCYHPTCTAVLCFEAPGGQGGMEGAAPGLGLARVGEGQLASPFAPWAVTSCTFPLVPWAPDQSVCLPEARCPEECGFIN